MEAITCEDFDLDGKDEMAVVRNWDGSIVLFELNSIGEIGFKTTLSTNLGTEWTDITSGDFDNDGMPEIIAHTNYDGNLHFIKYENNKLVLKEYQEYFTSGQLLNNIGSGNFSSDQSGDQIVTLRNISDALSVYTMEGICYGVSFSELLRDTDFGLIDYHIPNSIEVGGNFIVPSGINVELVSGAKITLSSGFRAESGANFKAKIDNSGNLSCGSSPYLRTSTIVNLPKNNNIELRTPGISQAKDEKIIEQEQEDEKVQDVESYMKLYPNPTNGVLNIETNFQSYRLELINSNGKLSKIEQFENSNGSIDLNDLPKGLYIIRIIKDNEVFIHKIIYQ